MVSPQVMNLLSVHHSDTLGHDLETNDCSKYSVLAVFLLQRKKSLAFLGAVWKQMIVTQNFRSNSKSNRPKLKEQ